MTENDKPKRAKKEAEGMKATASRETTRGCSENLKGGKLNKNTHELNVSHQKKIGEGARRFYSEGRNPFSQWIKSDNFKSRIPKEARRRCNLIEMEAGFHVAKTKEGYPICIFEMMQEKAKSLDYDSFMLRQFGKKGQIKAHGYGVLYTFNKTKKRFTFNVRKLTPQERFVGFFDEGEFVKFLLSTVGYFLRGVI